GCRLGQNKENPPLVLVAMPQSGEQVSWFLSCRFRDSSARPLCPCCLYESKTSVASSAKLPPHNSDTSCINLEWMASMSESTRAESAFCSLASPQWNSSLR